MRPAQWNQGWGGDGRGRGGGGNANWRENRVQEMLHKCLFQWTREGPHRKRARWTLSELEPQDGEPKPQTSNPILRPPFVSYSIRKLSIV